MHTQYQRFQDEPSSHTRRSTPGLAGLAPFGDEGRRKTKDRKEEKRDGARMGEQARRAPNHQGSTKICLGERPQEQPEDDRPGWEATSFENPSDEPGDEHHPYGIETVRRGIRPD